MSKQRDHAFQSYGIIPAAGHSRRMGQAKLRMPWGSTTVVEHVIAAWRRGGVDHVVAVVRRDDSKLARLCQQAGATVVQPETPPPEMKDSIAAALAEIATCFQPRLDAVWLLAPADMPRLSSDVIVKLLDEHRVACPEILVPTYRPASVRSVPPEPIVKRGHPVLFPWRLAQDVKQLGEDEGVNTLLAREPVREVAVEQPSILDDLDTKDDYQRLLANEDGM